MRLVASSPTSGSPKLSSAAMVERSTFTSNVHSQRTQWHKYSPPNAPLDFSIAWIAKLCFISLAESLCSCEGCSSPSARDSSRFEADASRSGLEKPIRKRQSSIEAPARSSSSKERTAADFRLCEIAPKSAYAISTAPARYGAVRRKSGASRRRIN
jgi:hypothetical protein